MSTAFQKANAKNKAENNAVNYIRNLARQR
jgi:hypothetical protein